MATRFLDDRQRWGSATSAILGVLEAHHAHQDRCRWAAANVGLNPKKVGAQAGDQSAYQEGGTDGGAARSSVGGTGNEGTLAV